MKEHRITLAGYFPDDGTKGKKKGDYIGGTVRFKSGIVDDLIKIDAKEVWINWAKKYPGSMIEIWIHQCDTYPPAIGSGGALFYSSNFDKFKAGSKTAEGTPF
jgi:hypothetical protein